MVTYQNDDTVDQDRSGVDQRYKHAVAVKILLFEIELLVVSSHELIDLLRTSNTHYCR